MNNQPPPNPQPNAWIQELALADAYHISPKALRRLLTRAGVPCRKTIQEHTHRGVTHKLQRTYWPAHLHPQAKPAPRITD